MCSRSAPTVGSSNSYLLVPIAGRLSEKVGSVLFFFFKQKTAYELLSGLVGSGSGSDSDDGGDIIVA